MAAQTTGGLIKTSVTVTEDQMGLIKRVAAEAGLSDSAAVRQLLDLGGKVYERRHGTAALVEELAVDAVAGETA